MRKTKHPVCWKSVKSAILVIVREKVDFFSRLNDPSYNVSFPSLVTMQKSGDRTLPVTIASFVEFG
jgi:hypothetical protein